MVLRPILSDNKEPTWSMGDDAPLETLSEQKRSFSDYFLSVFCAGNQSSTARAETRRSRRDRDVTMDDRQRSSLEIRDDEIDIPSFLKDR